MAKLAVRKQAAVGTGDSDQAIWLQVVCQQLPWKVKDVIKNIREILGVVKSSIMMRWQFAERTHSLTNDLVCHGDNG
jgi:L,D-peptidoglycan transpeptidase YkuD (ErfK/YbiS/YcfS/YnhG family)